MFDFKRRNNDPGNRGQVLLIAIFLMTILLASIPIVMVWNQLTSKFSILSSRRHQASFATEEGVALGMNYLSVPNTWRGILGGSPFPAVFDGTTVLRSSYTLISDTISPRESYQIRFISRSMEVDEHGTAMPVRATEVTLSQRTLGVHLPTDRQASAALQLSSAPIVEAVNALKVHWGPIVNFGTYTWTLNGVGDDMDNFRYPRKFSQGGIVGGVGSPYGRSPLNSQPPYSDQNEYWALSSLGFPPEIDESRYQMRANSLGFTPCTGCAQAPPNSGNMSILNGTGTFTGGGTGYSIPFSSAVVYMDGNAAFENMGVDAKRSATEGGGFIINGNLILKDPGISGLVGFALPIRQPPTAELEYFYTPARNPAPITVSPVHFRGFLYVKKDLIVETGNWIIIGAVRVDGQLIVRSPATLKIYYDDEINHQILTTTFEIKVDRLRELSPS